MSLILKYAGTQGDVGLILTATLINDQAQITASNIPLTEIGTSGLFISNNLLEVGETFENGLNKGTYLIRVIGESNEQRGVGVLEWDGTEEITSNDIKDRLWEEIEKKEIRDALGVSGDKAVASGGQLQKKSEEPYNKWQDTNDINKVGR